MTYRKGMPDERGSSIVSFLIALPLLCTLIAAMVDFGRLPLVMSDMARASDTAARYVAASPSASADTLRARVIEAAPSLASLDVSVEVAFDAVQEGSYTHHYYDPATGIFLTRPSKTATKPFVVHVRTQGEWLTPVGTLASDGFSFESTSAGTVDETVEGGSW